MEQLADDQRLVEEAAVMLLGARTQLVDDLDGDDDIALLIASPIHRTRAAGADH